MTEYYTYIGLYGYDSLMDLPRKMQWLTNLVIFSASMVRYPNFVLEMAGPTAKAPMEVQMMQTTRAP